MNRPSLRTMTISLVALILPITLLASGITTAYFKSTNPNDIDITQNLAYLRQSLFVAVVTFALIAGASIFGIVKMYRRDRSFVEAKLPMVLLFVVFVLMGGAAIANAYTNKVQNQYMNDNKRPTLQQYFNKLKEQKKR